METPKLDRRTFLGAVGAAGLLGAWRSGRAAEPQTATAPDLPFARDFEALPLAGAAERYFSEESLRRELGTSALLAPDDVEAVAYNFPSWHPSPYMEAHFGKGWTEFETLKGARPLFHGHLWPKFPSGATLTNPIRLGRPGRLTPPPTTA